MAQMSKRSSSSCRSKFGIEFKVACDVGFAEGFVMGDLETVSRKFASFTKASSVVRDAHQKAVVVRGLVYYLIQHEGEEWVRFSGPPYPPVFCRATIENLSRAMLTKGAFWFFDDTACAYGYDFFVNGKRLEHLLASPGSPPVFKSSLPNRGALKVSRGKEVAFTNRFFEEQRILVRRGFEWEISKGVSTLTGPIVEDAVGVHLVEAPWKSS